MTNLLSETQQEITDIGKSVEDVAWVGSSDGEHAISWKAFEPIAATTDYDSGYGGAEIAGDLVVMFFDGTWLERGEYDGSEWWTWKRPPTASGRAKPFTRVKEIEYESSIAGIASAQLRLGSDNG